MFGADHMAFIGFSRSVCRLTVGGKHRFVRPVRFISVARGFPGNCRVVWWGYSALTEAKIDIVAAKSLWFTNAPRSLIDQVVGLTADGFGHSWWKVP